MTDRVETATFAGELSAAGLADPRGALVLETTLLEFLQAEAPSDRPEDDVFAIFLATAPTRIAALEHALATGDTSGVIAAAHTLKGTARSLGAERMGLTAQVVEWYAARRRLEDAAVWAARLPDELAAVRAALAAYVPPSR